MTVQDTEAIHIACDTANIYCETKSNKKHIQEKWMKNTALEIKL